MELHAGDALDVGGDEIDGNRPYPVAQLGAVHDGLRLDGETPLAAVAAERHGGVSSLAVDIVAVAVGAADAVLPSAFDEPALGSGIIRELVNELHEGDAVPLGPPGRVLCHRTYILLFTGLYRVLWHFAI